MVSRPRRIARQRWLERVDRRAWMLAALAAVLMFAIQAGGAQAAPAAGHWSTTGPSGGVTTAFVEDPNTPATLYIGTDDGKVWRSTNTGASWAQASTGLPTGYGGIVALAADQFTTPTTLYAATANGLYKSTNGTTWTQLAAPLLQNYLSAIAIGTTSATHTTIYAFASGVGMIKSTNGGSTAALANGGLPSNADIGSLVVDPGNAAVVYAGGYNAIFRSTNSAGSWGVIDSGVPFSTNVYNLYAVPGGTYPKTTLYAGTGSGVLRSVNSGASWTDATGGDMQPGTPIGRFVSSATSPTTVYAAGYTCNDVYKTTTGTTPWTAVDKGMPGCLLSGSDLKKARAAAARLHAARERAERPLSHAAQLRLMGARAAGASPDALPVSFCGQGGGAPGSSGLAIDPASATTLIDALGDGHGVAKSTAATPSWGLVDTGFRHVDVNDVTVDPSTPSTVYAATSLGIYRSTNDGSSWAAFQSGMTPGEYPYTFTWAGDTLYVGGLDGSIYQSVSGGAWTQVTGDLPCISSLAVDATAPTKMYVALGGQGFDRSANGGATWVQSTKGLPWGFGQINAVTIRPGVATELVLGTGEGIYKSTNSGVSWTAVPGAAQEDSINLFRWDGTTSSANVYAGGDSTVYKAPGSTLAFTQPSSSLFGAFDALAIDPVNPATIWAGDAEGGGIYKSTNGGTSWTAENTSLTDKEINGLAYANGTNKVLHAATLNASEWDYGTP